MGGEEFFCMGGLGDGIIKVRGESGRKLGAIRFRRGYYSTFVLFWKG